MTKGMKTIDNIRKELRSIYEQYAKKGTWNSARYSVPVLKKNTPLEVKELEPLLVKSLNALLETEREMKRIKKQKEERAYQRDIKKLKRLLIKHKFDNAANFKDEHVRFNGKTGNLILSLMGYRPFISFFSDETFNGFFGKQVESKDLKYIKKIDGEPVIKFETKNDLSLL